MELNILKGGIGYYGKHYSAARVSTNINYDVHDIRKLALLLWKANINFIEVLFSEESRILAFNERMEHILGERERLARMNLPYLWNACQGMYFNKFRQLEKGTEETQHLVERYGYSTKEALHCYRKQAIKPDYTARQWLDEQVREVIRSSLKDDS